MRVMSNPLQTCRRFDDEDDGATEMDQDEGEELIVEPVRSGAGQQRGALQEKDTNVPVNGDGRLGRVKS